MKKSKHFRKDVIMARIIFAVLCILICVLIWMGIKALIGSNNEKEPPETETQTETETFYIPPVEETESQTEGIVETIRYAKTTAQVRMRKEPNTTCEVILSVPANTKTDLIEEADGWYKVSYNGREGYIRADYIEVVEETVPVEDAQ